MTISCPNNICFVGARGIYKYIFIIKLNNKIREGEAINNRFMDRLGKWRQFLLSPNLVGWLMCMPALVFGVLFFLVPAFVGFLISLYDWDGVTSMTFIGLDNYIEVFKIHRYWNAMLVNWLTFFGCLLTQIPLALFFAITLSKKSPIAKVYRSAIFAPRMLSVAAAGLLWSLVFDPYEGPLNQLLEKIGLESLTFSWLGEPNTALISLLIASSWLYFGFHMIIFMGGLASIPKEYYESVQLDTNNGLMVLWYITIPLLREQFLISFVIVFSGTFGALIGFFSLMTGGGPSGSTELLGLYMVSQAFRANRFGYASAIGVITFFIVFIVLLWPVIQTSRKRLEY